MSKTFGDCLVKEISKALSHVVKTLDAETLNDDLVFRSEVGKCLVEGLEALELTGNFSPLAFLEVRIAVCKFVTGRAYINDLYDLVKKFPTSVHKTEEILD